MERWQQDLEWWMANWPVLAGLLLWFASLLNSILPLAFVQRRLPRLSLTELSTQCPGLRWLSWGYPMGYVATSLLFLAAMWWVREESRRLSDTRGFFLMGAVFCIFPLIAAGLALKTGVYRGMTGRAFTSDYYHVAGSNLSWVPWMQVIVASVTAALSLAGFWAW